jgi:hypothetical protein
MMKSLILDLALARRVEMAEARTGLRCVEILPRSWPDCGAAFESIAGGYALYSGANSPLTQGVAMALDGPATEAEFDRLESFYRERKEPVRAEMCPLADPLFLTQFGKRGYRVTEFSNVMAKQLQGQYSAMSSKDATSNGITMERLSAEDAQLWGATVADGFAEHPPSIPEIVELMKTFALIPSVECYLARVDGNVTGGGAVSFCDDVAVLFAASTLPAFRGRGVQTALLQKRLARAAEAGSVLAVCVAQPGSTSQRNIARYRFETLYTRVKFEKDYAS